MIVAIMQPYFFPYIGYFQLMHAVDTFVFLDDVQYIDRGWVNRNRIPVDGKPAWLTMPVRKASRALPINRREYLLDEGTPAAKRKLRAAYRQSDDHAALESIEALLGFPDANVARFNAHHLREIAGWLGIGCRFATASELLHDEQLRGERRILELCRRLGATGYVNAIGGTALYDPANFAEAGIRLSFLRTCAPPSPCADGPAHLSVIDLLVRNGAARCRELLPRRELLDAHAAREASA